MTTPTGPAPKARPTLHLQAPPMWPTLAGPTPKAPPPGPPSWAPSLVPGQPGWTQHCPALVQPLRSADGRLPREAWLAVTSLLFCHSTTWATPGLCLRPPVLCDRPQGRVRPAIWSPHGALWGLTCLCPCLSPQCKGRHGPTGGPGRELDSALFS